MWGEFSNPPIGQDSWQLLYICGAPWQIVSCPTKTRIGYCRWQPLRALPSTENATRECRRRRYLHARRYPIVKRITDTEPTMRRQMIGSEEEENGEHHQQLQRVKAVCSILIVKAYIMEVNGVTCDFQVVEGVVVELRHQVRNVTHPEAHEPYQKKRITMPVRIYRAVTCPRHRLAPELPLRPRPGIFWPSLSRG